MMKIETLRKGVPKRTEFPLSIQKKKGIDTLVSGYSPGKVEEEKTPMATEESPFAALWDKYISWSQQVISNLEPIGKKFIQQPGYFDEVLTPLQINVFLQDSVRFPEEVVPLHFGRFITKLIQNSYDNGYNNFLLHPPTPISCLCEDARGGSKPLSVIVEGEMGVYTAGGAERIELTVLGSWGSFFCIGAQDSVFKTNSRDYVDYLIQEIPEGNKIMFIDEHGKEWVARWKK